MRHSVWKVAIVSAADMPAASLQEMPAHGTYYIESKFKNGIITIKRKARKLAEEDGIQSPLVSSMERLNTTIATWPT